jgi:hypothetical protein
MPKSRNILPPKRFWTPAEEEIMRTHYAHTLTVELARQFGCAPKRVLAKANAMGLHKSVALIAEMARQRTLQPDHGSRRTQIKPGQEPWNKGTHFVAGGRSAETRFKPGSKPHTWVPVGSCRVAPDGVLEQKVNDLPGPNSVRWKPVARLVWEAEHGPIPAGYSVVFKRGRQTTDRELITLDALECLSRSELMARNSLHNYPKEIVGAVLLLGAMKRKIRERAEKEAA